MDRDEHGRFCKGNKANPGGRPKGLAERARAATHDGADLIEFYLGIFNNKEQDVKYRIDAAEWLADRGWGKPVQTTELVGSLTVKAKGYTRVSPDDWPARKTN